MTKVHFKKGDILQPKSNRYRSNDINIRNIKTIIVISTKRRWAADKHMTIQAEVLTGECSSYGLTIRNITVFDDAFELVKPKENYPIF